MKRRSFLKTLSAGAAGFGLATSHSVQRLTAAEEQPWFTIALEEHSFLHDFERKKIRQMDTADFIKREYGIDVIQRRTRHMPGSDPKYMAELKRRSDEAGVRNSVLVYEAKPALNDPDSGKRHKVADELQPWMEAAKTLGCHSLRLDVAAAGKNADQELEYAADGVRRAAELAAAMELTIALENHFGHTRNAAWLRKLIEKIGQPNCVVLFDCGNINGDRYEAAGMLAPLTKVVSAKCFDFDAEGRETKLDYLKMMKVFREAGFRGEVAIEYEGKQLPPAEGVRAMNQLLLAVRQQLSR